ncbi:MAG TPA: FecR domain-containing protein, partial [Planctomycetota bacterium]|nr:FecR domain-containing protein [Planctomycetota bacterium]
AGPVVLVADGDGGGIEVLRDGARLTVTAPLPLRHGDRVVAGAPASVRYPDGTRLRLAAGAELLVRSHAPKRLQLGRGSLDADIAPQPPDAAFAIDTPHAMAEVLGTRFALAVDDAATRLAVATGRVRLSSPHGAALDVGAGASATATAAGATLDAPPRADQAPSGRVIVAQPATLAGAVADLRPGDTLRLVPGDYRANLSLRDLHGTPDAWITIAGPATRDAVLRPGPQPRQNTLELTDCSFVRLEGLVIDGSRGPEAAGIKGKAGVVHHVVIDDCDIRGFAADQQLAAVSVQCAAWDWTIRRCRIDACGAGISLGAGFVGGIVEGNLIADIVGYGLYLAPQPQRAVAAGMPDGRARTLIRDNVLLGRADGADRDRPHALIGGLPISGPGSDDVREIHGNLFHGARGEVFVQAAGRVSIHDNLFVDADGTAIKLMSHAGLPLVAASVYRNTILGAARGVSVAEAAVEQVHVVGNVIAAAQAVSGPAVAAHGIHVREAEAAGLLVAPVRALGSFDLAPLPGRCVGDPIDLTPFADDVGVDRDFAGARRVDATGRGAYDPASPAARWRPAAERKPTP